MTTIGKDNVWDSGKLNPKDAWEIGEYECKGNITSNERVQLCIIAAQTKINNDRDEKGTFINTPASVFYMYWQVMSRSIKMGLSDKLSPALGIYERVGTARLAAQDRQTKIMTEGEPK